MTCLNKTLPINLKKMKDVFMKKLDKIIEQELYYLENVKDQNKDNLRKIIIKEMKKEFEYDNLMYSIMDDNYCTFKHRRGKHDGNFCCKKITKNGNKKHYLCRTHNKDHIPKKKDVIPNNIDLVKIDIKKSYSENKNNEIPPGGYIENKIKKNDNIINNFSFKKVNNDYNINEVIQLKDKRLNYNTINKKKIKQNHKIYINGFNINSFRNIINNYEYKYYENTICKFNKTCNNKICKYKHTNEEFLIKDILYNSNSNYILSF